MKNAKHLMTKDLILVQSGSEIREQVKSFLENNISSAPVVTPLGELLGNLTELSLIRAYLLLRINNDDSRNKVIHHKEILEPAAVVQESDPVINVIKALMKSPTKRVLVQNNMKNLTGIISPKDILHFLAGEDKQSGLMKDELEATKQRLTEVKEELKDMQVLLKNYQHLYQDSPTMMHSVDANGKIMMANKKIHQILGYEPGELIGKTIFDIYAKNCHAEATFGLKRIMEEGFHNATYTSMVTKEGDKIRVDIASTALRNNLGKFVGTISASRVVDADALLRALHGVFNREDINPEDIKTLLEEEEKKEVKP